MNGEDKFSLAEEVGSYDTWTRWGMYKQLPTRAGIEQRTCIERLPSSKVVDEST